MKRIVSFVSGLVVGGLLLGGSYTYADLVAQRSIMPFYLNGKQVEAEAYLINGNNYFKLRDIAALVDFGVTWDQATGAVHIDTTVGYAPEGQTQKPLPSDYASQANPAVFNDFYTPEVYDIIREAMVNGASREAALSESETQAILNACAAVSSYPFYEISYGKNSTGTLIPRYPDPMKRAAEAVSGIIASAEGKSDLEKLRIFADAVCERLDYDKNYLTAPVRYFTTEGVSYGNCMSFAHGLKFLCNVGGVPCILVHSNIHQWNQVYIDGEWYEVDLTSYEISYSEGRQVALLGKDFAKDTPRIYTLDDPDLTAFTKELVVPGSTK